MTSPLVAVGATILCPHGGQAVANAVAAGVAIGGAAAVPVASPLTIVGCGLPPSAGGPCTGGTWLTGTTRVTAGGQALATAAGGAVAVPTGAPLIVVGRPGRVVAV